MLGERLRRTAVHGEAVVRGDLAGERGADQLVDEPVPVADHHQHAGVQGRVEQRVQLRLRSTEQREGARVVEVAAGQRQPAQTVDVTVVQIGQSGGHGRAHGGHGVGILVGDPGQLDQHERVAGRLGPHPGADGLGQIGRHGPQDPVGLGIAERVQLQLVRPAGTGQPAEDPGEGGVGGRLPPEEHHDDVSHRGCDGPEHVDGGLVGQVGIVENEHDGSGPDRTQQLLEGTDHLVA